MTIMYAFYWVGIVQVHTYTFFACAKRLLDHENAVGRPNVMSKIIKCFCFFKRERESFSFSFSLSDYCHFSLILVWNGVWTVCYDRRSGLLPSHKLLRDRQDTNEDCNIIAKRRNRDRIRGTIVIDHASQTSR